ncbi:MAG: hypothetical protein AAF826_02160 [Pseudomonadota bacterium]
MRYVLLSLLCVLAACSTGVFYYKDDAVRSELASTQAQCVLDAAKQAPVNRVIVRDYGHWESIQSCDGNNCKTVRNFVPGLVRTYDANAGLRSRLERACMAAQGFERLEFERCQDIAAVDASVQMTLPKAADVACFAKDKTGRVAFIEK